ncbi:MAG: DoxX family membrane protein [Methylocystaceae bacterium]|nr:DoxX family membrane protein [Methylocystaceae bacterium]
MMDKTFFGLNGKILALWLLRLSVAFVFLYAAMLKVSGNERMIEEFELLGLGHWFRYAVALIEALGSILLLVPILSWLGVIILIFVDAGALVAQLMVLHNNVVHIFIIALFLVAIPNLQRASREGGA